MAPSKLPVMYSLSRQFASRYGFSLEGVARCLHNTSGVTSGDGTAAADDPRGSKNGAEYGEHCCRKDYPNQIESVCIAAASLSEGANSRGGNGLFEEPQILSHIFQPSSGVMHVRPSSSSSLGLEPFPVFQFRSTLCNHATSSLGVFARGVRTLAADIKPGNVVELKGKLQEVVKTVWTMQGRGSSSIQVELRDINSGSKNVDKWRPETALERVILEDREFTFLYDDGASAVLMDPKTFDQAAVDKALFGEARGFLKDGMPVKVAFHGETPVTATLPPQVRCRVVEAAPAFKTERKTASTKMVTLDTGVRIQVPGFIEEGEEVLVKTADITFVARAKGE